MLLTTPFTPERASQIPRAIRKPAWGFINPLTAATLGRSLLATPVFQLVRASIAMPPSEFRSDFRQGLLVFNRPLPTAVLHSTAVRSHPSLSIRATRIFSTFH